MYLGQAFVDQSISKLLAATRSDERAPMASGGGRKCKSEHSTSTFNWMEDLATCATDGLLRGTSTRVTAIYGGKTEKMKTIVG
jgi:hypothetical protein